MPSLLIFLRERIILPSLNPPVNSIYAPVLSAQVCCQYCLLGLYTEILFPVNDLSSVEKFSSITQPSRVLLIIFVPVSVTPFSFCHSSFHSPTQKSNCEASIDEHGLSCGKTVLPPNTIINIKENRLLILLTPFFLSVKIVWSAVCKNISRLNGPNRSSLPHKYRDVIPC